MSSSDNVLRGGLTSKHVDVKELLNHVSYKPVQPKIIPEKRYQTISEDFKLDVYRIATDEKIDFTAGSVEIILLTEGSVELSNGKLVLELRQGSPAAVAMPGESVKLKALSPSVIFRAYANPD